MIHRVGLNGLFLHFPHSGTGRYLRHLIRGLADETELRLYSATAYPSRFEDRTIPSTIDLGTPFDGRAPAIAKVWFEQIAYASAAHHAKVDVSHVPYFAPPVISRGPTVVTVHDLVPLINADYRRSAAQRLYVSLVVAGLRSASLIITDSRASAADLTKLTGTAASKIRVIPLGVDERFHPARDAGERESASLARRNAGVECPYILCVTGFDRRKNVDRLIQAFAQACVQRHISQKLVLIGALRPGDDFFYDPRPDIERLGVQDVVVLLGARTDHEVWALMNGADAFVFPSLYEGFGLPPLEALACATPVICSRASSLPEVVGDAGQLFDPTDVDSMADAIALVANDRDLRVELASRGPGRAREFTWAATVERTKQVYREVRNEWS